MHRATPLSMKLFRKQCALLQKFTRLTGLLSSSVNDFKSFTLLSSLLQNLSGHLCVNYSNKPTHKNDRFVLRRVIFILRLGSKGLRYIADIHPSSHSGPSKKFFCNWKVYKMNHSETKLWISLIYFIICLNKAGKGLLMF